MRKKLVRAVLAMLALVVIGLLLFVSVSMAMFSPEYILRTIRYGDSDVGDYQIFAERTIHQSSHPYTYNYELDVSLPELPVSYTSNGTSVTKPLRELIHDTSTTSMIVVHEDKVVFEGYDNGYDKDSVNTSFSMAKSVVSLLIGIAIEEGFIQNKKQSIADYIQEFKGTDMEQITIEDLLLMRSPITYKEGGIWFGDDAKTYYMPDLRQLALTHTDTTDEYAGRFHYNNYHPLLLGLILERSTGMHVAGYMEQKLWEKIGAEHDASWSLDSQETGFEKMESGINFKAIDFVKIGSMLLHGGVWNGQHVLSDSWIKQSTLAELPLSSEYEGSFLENANVGYKYLWYSTPHRDGGELDYFAMGKFGQYLYVSPARSTVILRTGKAQGKVDRWPDIFFSIAEAVSSK